MNRGFTNGRNNENWTLFTMQKAGLITGDHDPDEIAPKWFVLKVLLNALKVVK